LGHASHIAYGALVELPHGFVLEYVTAFDLASRLILFAVAGIDADDVGEAVGIEDAFGEWNGALLEEAEADFGAICGVSGGHCLDGRERQGREGQGESEEGCCGGFACLVDEIAAVVVVVNGIQLMKILTAN